MKKILYVILLIIPQILFSQAKVKTTISTEYDRNSISIIYISRGDAYDFQMKKYMEEYFLNSDFISKFDINFLDTKEIEIDIPRDEKIPFNLINQHPILKSVGKEILGYWFQRDENGFMNPELVETRGRYNANDQDYLNSQISKIGLAAIMDSGYELIDKSYLIFLDYSNIVKSINNTKETSWQAQANIYVYRLDYNEDVNHIMMNKVWIYEDDSEEEIERKKAAWEDLQIKMHYINQEEAISIVKEEDGGLEKAIISSYMTSISNLENKIDSWNVVSSITDTKPIRSKIGSKEGVKNMARYRAYYFYMDKHGNIVSKPKGYLRATKVADNRINASGKTPQSEFYQIAGFKLEKGMILKQSNDLGLGIGLSYRTGSFKGYYINADKLLKINTRSLSQYLLFNFGLDFLLSNQLKNKDIDYLSDISGLNFINTSLGYSFGIRPFRFIEFSPYVLFGIDGININGKETTDFLSEITGTDISNSQETNNNENDKSFYEKIASIGTLGIKINMNICYPLQIFGSADYTMIISEGKIFKQHNDLLNRENLGHKNGIGFNFGFKYIF